MMLFRENKNDVDVNKSLDEMIIPGRQLYVS